MRRVNGDEAVRARRRNVEPPVKVAQAQVRVELGADIVEEISVFKPSLERETIWAQYGSSHIILEHTI